MIISHKNKFIFIKPHKVAGTSVLHAFSQVCGEHDVVCPTSRKYHGKTHSDYSKNNKGFDTHASWRLSLVTLAKKDDKWKEIWNSYFKFTIIRNPWDQHVSYYCWKYLKSGFHNSIDARSIIFPGDKNFKNLFVKSIKEFPDKWQEDYYFHRDYPLADFYIRFENLEKDVKFICTKLNLKEIKLPKMKNLKERNKRQFPYSRFYDKETKELVFSKHKKFIELFNYKFDNSSLAKSGIGTPFVKIDNDGEIVFLDKKVSE